MWRSLTMEAFARLNSNLCLCITLPVRGVEFLPRLLDILWWLTKPYPSQRQAHSYTTEISCPSYTLPVNHGLHLFLCVCRNVLLAAAITRACEAGCGGSREQADTIIPPTAAPEYIDTGTLRL